MNFLITTIALALTANTLVVSKPGYGGESYEPEEYGSGEYGSGEYGSGGDKVDEEEDKGLVTNLLHKLGIQDSEGKPGVVNDLTDKRGVVGGLTKN